MKQVFTVSETQLLLQAAELCYGITCPKAVSVNHFKQFIKKVAVADISDSHTAIM